MIKVEQSIIAGGDKFWIEFQELLDHQNISLVIKDFLMERGISLMPTYTETLIAEIGDIGFYEIDLTKKKAYRNDRWLSMLGYSQRSEINDISLWEKLVHPNDKIRTKEEIKSLFKGTTKDIEIEYRLKRADGKYLWILDRGKIIEFDEDGTPSKIAGIQLNVDALHKNKEEVNRLYELLEAAPDYVTYYTKKGVVYYANKALVNLLGFDPKKENNLKLARKTHPKHSNRILNTVAIPFATEYGLWQGKTSIISKNDEEVPVYQTLICHKDLQGKAIYFSAVMKNISEESETVKALEQSEKKFRAIAETAQATIIIYKGSQFIYASPSFLDLTGYSKEEALKNNIWKLVHPDDRQMVRDNGFGRLENKDIPSRYEFRLLTKSGEIKWIDFTSSSIQIDGETMVLGVATDITENKNIKLKLKESEKRNKSLAGVLPEIVLETDFEGNIKFVNSAVLEAFGYSENELETFTNIYELVHDNYIPKLKEDLENLFENKVGRPEEYIVCKKDGTAFPVIGSSSLVYKKNNPVGFRTILVNVSSQNQLVSKLKESESKLTQILENSDEAHALFDKRRNCVEFNERFKNLINKLHGVQVFKGMSLEKLVPKNDWKKWNDIIDKVQGGEKVNFNESIIINDELFHTEINVFSIKGVGRAVRFAFIGRNITSRVNHEQQLLKQEKMLEGVNHATFQLLTEKEVKTVTYSFLKTVGKAFEADRAYVFQNVINSDGQICTNLTFEWSAEDVNPKSNFSMLKELSYHEAGILRAYHLLSRQKPYYGLVKNFPSSEKEVLQPQNILSILVCPIFIKDIFWGFIGLDDCKSERNWSSVEMSMLFSLANAYGGSIEREDLLQKMRIAKEKAEVAFKEKTNFLSTMSHEIRTPMNAVIGMTHLLLNNKPREDQKENLELLNFSSQNLLNLINDILYYSKIEANKATLLNNKFNLRNTVNAVISTFKGLLNEKGLGLEGKIDSELDCIFISDSVKLIQILSNLMSNAIKFTEKGSITVEVQQFDATKDYVYVRFNIHDTGIGMEAEMLDYIFESFTQVDSSEKRTQGGTGLGLAITKKLVALFGSEINVISEVGVGSTFYFDLKLKKAKSSESMESDENTTNAFEDESVVKGKRVLLVEDNKVNQVVANKFLKSYGMQVEIAENGLIAMGILQKRNFDVVLMDLQMPVMDGITATKEIRKMKGKKWKELPIIAFTAAVLGEEELNARNAGMNEFVSKPFNPKMLLNKISRLVMGKESVAVSEPFLDKKTNNEIRLKPNIHFFAEMANDDRNFLMEILLTFTELMQESKRHYCKALSEGNLEELNRIRHKIKGELFQVDALLIDELMEQGKQIIMDAESSRIEGNVLKTEESIDILISFLKSEMNKL